MIDATSTPAELDEFLAVAREFHESCMSLAATVAAASRERNGTARLFAMPATQAGFIGILKMMPTIAQRACGIAEELKAVRLAPADGAAPSMLD